MVLYVAPLQLYGEYGNIATDWAAKITFSVALIWELSDHHEL
jgi:hypothetical protein